MSPTFDRSPEVRLSVCLSVRVFSFGLLSMRAKITRALYCTMPLCQLFAHAQIKYQSHRRSRSREERSKNEDVGSNISYRE